jgi:hypothetical protein
VTNPDFSQPRTTNRERPLVERRPLRLPLQTGESALRDLYFCAAAFVPGLLVIAGAVGMFAWFTTASDATNTIAAWMSTGPYLAMAAAGGLRLMAKAALRLSRAVHHRPADLALDAVGVYLVDGPHAAKFVGVTAWKDAAAERWRVSEIQDAFCLVTGPAAGRMVMAEAYQLDEATSLRAIAALVDAVAHDATQPALLVPHTWTLTCAACGAATKPDDVPTVPCVYCQATVVVPNADRGRIRAARALATSQQVTRRLVKRFLAQPSARRVNAFAIVIMPVMLLAWPTALGMLAWLEFTGRLDWRAAVALPMLLVSILWFGRALGNAVIAGRRALQSIVVGTNAVQSSNGDPECRLCCAPLEGNGPVEVCRFCGAPNLLGINYPSAARASLERERSLRDALQRAAERRRVALLELGLAVAGLVVGVMLLRTSLGR